MKLDSVKLFASSLFFVLVSVSLPVHSNADPLDVWHWRNPLPQGNDLNGVAFGNGTFVAVGGHGTVLTSSDGINWVLRPSGTDNSLERVTFGNGIFVAVGSAGTILTSVDGINWVPRSSGTIFSLRGVTYGGGLFIAVGDNAYTVAAPEGIILSSPDGGTWTPQASTVAGILTGVAFGNGIFVVGGPHLMYISSDALNWAPAAGGSDGFNDIAFGNGIFVSVGGGCSNGTPSNPIPTFCSAFVRTSPDGLNWTTTRSTSGSGASSPGPLQGIAFGNGTFVAVARGGQDNILTSGDGANWTVRVQAGFSLKGVALGNSGFIAVGGLGTLVSSPDGVEWVSRSTWVNGGSAFPGPYVPISKVVFANNLFVAFGDYGIILTSPDGVVWTSQNSGTTNTLNAVIFENGTFVVVGVNGTILTSSDGVVWTSQNSGTTNRLNSVVFGNGIFVVVGDFTILTSPDGVTWTAQATGIAPYIPWDEVTFLNGLFVAIGESDIITSPDGTNWALTFINWGSGVTGPSGHVVFGNGLFVAARAVGPSAPQLTVQTGSIRSILPLRWEG